MFVIFFLVLLTANRFVLMECSPFIQGRSTDYSTDLLKDSIDGDFETEDDDIEINKIATFTRLPFDSVTEFNENQEPIPATVSIDQTLNQKNQTADKDVLKSQETFTEYFDQGENLPGKKKNFDAEVLMESTMSSVENPILMFGRIASIKTVADLPMKLQLDVQSNTIQANVKEDVVETNTELPKSNAHLMGFNQSVFVGPLVTTLHSDYVVDRDDHLDEGSLAYGHYSDFEDPQSNDYINEHNAEDVNDDNDELQNDDNALPFALKNLPRDIPPDRTIYEVLAENIVKDKRYDELRIEELIHELMDHYDTRNGLGEVYADETDYDIKAMLDSKGIITSSKEVETSSTVSS